MTNTQKTLLYSASAVTVGVGGWYAFRMFVRSKTREVLVTDYNFDKVLRNVGTFEDLLGVSLNLPSLDELVVSLVPIWDTTLPDTAFRDILEQGRASRYWPEAYKKPVSQKYEKMIFRALKAAGETPENADTLDMAVAAGLSLLQRE
jgi:hypothetical protein